MNRRRFFGWAAGMLGAGLFLGARKEPEKPDFVPYPWCGLGRGQNHRPHPSDKEGWAYCTVSCWACDHNLDMQRTSGLYRCEFCGMRNSVFSTTSVHAEDCPIRPLWMYTAEGKKVFPSGQKARNFYEEGI